ncbi:MAG: DUF2497 domain-containing protein [Holosporales bacterium]|jgi:cell pole-organizing protein PopZ|nr:DUF2497 domain-containing protein [Holosporales bacterium]
MVSFSDKDEEMSMEDILASIRKYVSEEDENKKSSSADQKKELNFSEQGNVIKLEQSHVLNSDNSMKQITDLPPAEEQDFYEEKSDLAEQVVTPLHNEKKSSSPFSKLTDAIKSYGKNNTLNKSEETVGSSNLTIDQFLSEIASQVIQKWADANLRKVVEEIVMKEIEKIKSE